MWSFPNLELIKTVANAHNNLALSCLKLTGKYLVTGSADTTIKIWKIKGI